MATKTAYISPGSVLRPQATADYRSRPTHTRVGVITAVMGIMVAMVAFAGSLFTANQVANDGGEVPILADNAWTFGVATVALGIMKTGIALILWGIVRRLWIRVESVKAGLPRLVPDVADKASIPSRSIGTPYGRATHTEKAPPPTTMHRMAYAMWAPMLVMGAMVTTAGLVLSLIEASAATGDRGSFLTLSALAQGTEFLGEALILSGISFILGSILGSLRQGGGEVQETVGVGVKTPVMPVIAKAFVGLMMMGLMLAMVQFILYLFVATLDNETTIAAYFAWLAPLREVSLGIILSGIVLALATIGTKILPFQFWRIRELITDGK